MKLIRSPILCFCICLATAPSFFFFFNDTATTEIYTLSLHDALPISRVGARRVSQAGRLKGPGAGVRSPRLGMGALPRRAPDAHPRHLVPAGSGGGAARRLCAHGRSA